MRVAVVIPCFRVRSHILSVLARMSDRVEMVYVVDDQCPEGTGKLVETNCRDRRIKVIFNSVNQGVGGATMAGYRRALADGADIVVKLDGDGQMDPALIPRLIAPLERGVADYSKGNRFHCLENLEGMHLCRKLGNTGLSFFTKIASGYWNVMDPTNGFTAIHSVALSMLPLSKIEKRYFFESDMLFRLNTIRAVVRDVAMQAVYADEKSGLSVTKSLLEFPGKLLSRFSKRIFYNYVLRDFNACTVELLAGVAMLSFGVIFGGYNWYAAAATHLPTPTGTIMLSVLPIIVGVQLLLAAVSLDVLNVPSTPLQEVGASMQEERALSMSKTAANDG